MKLRFEIIPFLTPAYDEMVALRDEVLRKPLGLSFSVEDLTAEKDQTHIGAYTPDGRLAGCLILQALNKDRVKMRQVAVAPSLQSRGIGSELVGFAERWARRSGYRQIELCARLEATGFYKNLKYRLFGKPFYEVGILHRHMRKDIAAE